MLLFSLLIPRTVEILMYCSDKEVGVGGAGPEDGAMEDDLLNTLAIPIPFSRRASVCIW